MRAAKLGAMIGLSAIGLTAASTVARAQYDGARAPRISISTAFGGAVATNYVEPSISLSEDAYVLAISVDLNRNIRILHPEYPGITVKMNSRRDLHLPRFFGGFSDRDRNVAYDGYGSSYNYGYDPGYSDTRGTIIALASRRPFDLDAITVNNDWDVLAIERIIGGRDPQSAASALAQRLGARGEPIGRDFYRFTGRSHNYTSYYNTAYYGCNPTYSALGGFPGYGGINFFRANQLREAGYKLTYIGHDPCGQPRFIVSQSGLVTTPARPPAVGAFPPSRIPDNVSRNPGRGRPAPSGSNGSTTRGVDDFPDRLTPRTPPDRGAGRQPPPDRAQPPKGSFPSERTRTAPAEPRQPVEPVRSSPPPERAQPQERPQRTAEPPAPPRETERPKPVP